jgi:hypothetical protein
MEKIFISGKECRKYIDGYYISQYGDVYSLYSKKFLKHYIDKDGYHRVDIHKKHKKVHRLVYLVWNGKIDKGKQINHKDDNKNNNYYDNLYQGTQKENMIDKNINEHTVGNLYSLILYDINEDVIINFCPSSDFIEYSGHPCKNGSLKRMFKKNWFKKRYIVLEYKKVMNRHEIESVTTMWDEYTTVE